MNEPDERTYMCIRCYHRWDGLEGAALCGDCWRAFQAAEARVQALAAYVKHRPGCASGWRAATGSSQIGPCDCGLDAALTEPRREEEREPQ